MSEASEAPAAMPLAHSCASPDMVSGTPQTDQQQSFTEPSEVSQHDEEQALESHEVIELQAFSERKAWIEAKITVRTCHYCPCLQIELRSSWRHFLL
jgi:hypothetical protein